MTRWSSMDSPRWAADDLASATHPLGLWMSTHQSCSGDTQIIHISIEKSVKSRQVTNNCWEVRTVITHVLTGTRHHPTYQWEKAEIVFCRHTAKLTPQKWLLVLLMLKKKKKKVRVTSWWQRYETRETNSKVSEKFFARVHFYFAVLLGSWRT